MSQPWFSIIISSMILPFFFFFFCSPILLTTLRIFPATKIKNMCNVLTLDDMHASLPDVKYRPPPLMIHHHRVPLFAFQNLLCSSHVLAHSCTSLSLKCGVYQAWLCPLVWCCLIHPEDLNRSFILCIILRIVLSLIVRIVPTPSRLSISHKLA